MQKKSTQKDWHKADIIAAIRKTGTSLRAISRKHGLAHTAIGNALHISAPKYERIIAQQLGIPPQEIWPSRYHEDGRPKSGRGERGRGRHKPLHKQFNATEKKSNVDRIHTRIPL